MAPCLWCGKRLIFSARGWVHADSGQTYETQIGADGKERDDHCALPMAPTHTDESHRRRVIA